jgi:MFS family permease
LFAALVADASSAEQRGTAFGVFNLATGLALLVASALAGAIWDRYSAGATFVTGAAITLVAGLVALVLYGAGRLQPGPAAGA